MWWGRTAGATVEVGEKDGPVLILGYDLGRILTVCIDLLLDLVLGACEVLPNGHGWGSALFVIKYCWIRPVRRPERAKTNSNNSQSGGY